MRFVYALVCLTIISMSAASAQAPAELPPPELTEVWTPVPARVAPGARDADPPADAIVVFDGRNADAWLGADGRAAQWRVIDGSLMIVPDRGDLQTQENFGDVQLHIEWMPPVLPADRTGQDRGNSGVFLQGRYEVQVLDTLENITYPNGQAGAIYKQHIPLVNASRPAGVWQSYDIIFTAPRFAADGALTSPARMTVLHNGVLIQNNVTLAGPTVFRGAPAYEAHGDAPLMLQDHGHQVRYRNIWLRRL